MNFTGSELTVKRNFYTQTGEFGFGVSCIVDNTTGAYRFGVTGAQGALEFRLESGRLYYQNQFIHTYQSDEEFLIEAQFTSGAANVLKDGAAMIYGAPKATGLFDYFYMMRATPDLGAAFSLNISGNNLPSYTVSNRGYLLTSGQDAVTGYFINQSAFPVRVFDSQMQASADYLFGKLAGTINGAGTGTFAYTGDYDVIDFSSPILTTFNTNFADVDVLFSIVDARAFNRFVFLTAPTDFGLNSDNTLERTVSWQNYSGGFVTNAFDASLTFSLKYVTGSGTFSSSSFGGSVPYTGQVFGSFAKSGLLTGAVVFPTGDADSTGVYSISLSQFGWATGRATGFFSGLGTGLASGIGYTGRAISAFTGLYTGFIYGGSGTLQVNSAVTGLPVGPAYSLDYTSYTNATGFLNLSGMSLGSSFYLGSFSSPLVKGVQFVNETGLVYYLSGAPQHMVNGVYDGGIINLTATPQGVLGNGIQIQEYQCEQGAGLYAFSSFLTGGTANGTTGDAVVSIGTFTGAPGFTITGSGAYVLNVAGTGQGTFLYTRTFTGAWDFYTGIDADNLVSLKAPGQFNGNTISGSGSFSPNSQMTIRIINRNDGLTTDQAQLIITGTDVLNAINQTLTTYA